MLHYCQNMSPCAMTKRSCPRRTGKCQLSYRLHASKMTKCFTNLTKEILFTRNKISSVAKFWNLLQGARGAQSYKFSRMRAPFLLCSSEALFRQGCFLSFVEDACTQLSHILKYYLENKQPNGLGQRGRQFNQLYDRTLGSEIKFLCKAEQRVIKFYSNCSIH